MVKIFAKTMIDGKIKKTYKFETPEDFEMDHFFDYVRCICEHFDSPTPVILAKHIREDLIFITVTSVKDDFVEKVFFDKRVEETYKGI